MCNPVRAGTHPSKEHFDSQPLSDEHKRTTHTRVTVHPQQSTARLANLGTKQHVLVKGSGSTGASPVCPIPVPINHFWQVAGKQLLMIVLLQSAGSHLLTLPAVVCLPERDKRTDADNMPAAGKIRSKLSREPDVLPCGKTSTSKPPFGFGCFLGLIFKQLDACTDFFVLHPKNQGKYPKDNFEFAVAARRISHFPPSRHPGPSGQEGHL